MVQGKLKKEQIDTAGTGNIATDEEVAQMISGSYPTLDIVCTQGASTSHPITVSTSGSVVKSLRVQNNEQIGGSLEVEGNIFGEDLTLNQNASNNDAIITFNKPTTGTETLKWNNTNQRFEFSDYLYVNSDIEIKGNIETWYSLLARNDLYLNYQFANQDVVIHFGKSGGSEETLKWNKTNLRFEFSDPVFTDNYFITASSGSVLKSLRVQNNEQIGGSLEVDGNAKVDGTIQVLTSGSVFKSLNVVNNLQVGGTIIGQNILSRGGTLYNSAGIANAALNIIVWYAPFACTVTNVRGYRVGGTGATINARCSGSLNHLASALSLTLADIWLDGGAVQNTAYAVGEKLEIMVASTAGTVTQLAIQIDFTKP